MKNVPVPGARPGSGVPVPEESWLAGTAVCPRVRIFQYFSRAGGRKEGRKGGREGSRQGGREGGGRMGGREVDNFVIHLCRIKVWMVQQLLDEILNK